MVTPAASVPFPRVYRWMVLLLVSLAMFGNLLRLRQHQSAGRSPGEQLGFTDSNIGLLNAIYSIPNIVMVLIGGLIIDRIGTRNSTVIFAVLCLLGAAVTASGTLEVMAAGRLIFGLGRNR